jgi:cytochrome c peroxidase
LNNTIACASCHPQQQGFSDPRRFSSGFNDGLTGRNAMGLANLRFTNLQGQRPGFFWDERAATLEDQVLMPIQDQVEMGMDLTTLEAKLRKLPYYPVLFTVAFGEPHVTRDRIAKAVAQFMRAMVSFDAKFDRAAEAAGGNYQSPFPGFSDEENLGKSLFVEGVGGVGEIGCAHCHMPPTFGMPQSFNNGLELVYKDQGLGARDVRSNDPFTPTNNGKFKAPSLRNIALTAPYMHDGRFANLEQVIEHYSSGVHPHVNLGIAFNEDMPAATPTTSGFRLTATQKSALVAFLKTLTDEKFVSDPRFSDPFVRLKANGATQGKIP